MATIDFTGTGTGTGGGAPQRPPFSTAPMTVSREVADEPASLLTSGESGMLSRALVEGGQAPSQPAPSSQSSGPEADAPKGPDPDEIYEQVVERLRHDLIAELEQHGHLFRETL